MSGPNDKDDGTVTQFPKKPRAPKQEAAILPFPPPDFAVAKSNGATWETAVECLEELIRDIKCGTVRPSALYVAVHQVDTDPEGVKMSTFPGYSWSQKEPHFLTLVETVGLLEAHKIFVFDD